MGNVIDHARGADADPSAPPGPADALALWARERSAHRQEAVRVELDPTVLW